MRSPAAALQARHHGRATQAGDAMAQHQAPAQQHSAAPERGRADRLQQGQGVAVHRRGQGQVPHLQHYQRRSTTCRSARGPPGAPRPRAARPARLIAAATSSGAGRAAAGQAVRNRTAAGRSTTPSDSRPTRPTTPVRFGLSHNRGLALLMGWASAVAAA